MKILVAGLKNNLQLKRLVDEGKKDDCEVVGCYSSELVITAEKNNFEPTLRGKSLQSYDLIYLWAVSKRRWEWYTACYFLNKKFGTKIVNAKIIDPTYQLYLSPAMDYIKQIDNKILFPKSHILHNKSSVKAIASDLNFPVILKTASGRQGSGVFKIESAKELEDKITELKAVSDTFVVREFIPNDGDIRVFES